MPATMKSSKKSRSGIPPYLVSDHCFVVLPIQRGGDYGPKVYGLAEPQHLDPQADGVVNMNIYTWAELREKIARGAYLPAWSWREVERMGQLTPSERWREAKLRTIKAALRRDAKQKAGAR